jgi:type IV secretory pathway component VirB8
VLEKNFAEHFTEAPVLEESLAKINKASRRRQLIWCAEGLALLAFVLGVFVVFLTGNGGF